MMVPGSYLLGKLTTLLGTAENIARKFDMG
jgi:hypothetical protein